MTTPLTFLEAARAAQVAAQATYDDFQAYRTRFPSDASLAILQANAAQAYRSARVCYDMWDLHRAGVSPRVIRDWVRCQGHVC